MKKISIAFATATIASMICLRAAEGNAPVWRCAGEDCTDVIINDIADVTVRDWPASTTLAMPGLPYSCSVKTDQCRRCLAGGAAAGVDGGPSGPASVGPISTQGIVAGTVPWSVVFAGSLQSFLFGTYTASADVAATVTPSTGGSWGGTAIHYLYQGACSGTTCSYVQAPGGDTGVVDLGLVNYSTAAGDFWNASLPFSFVVPTPDIVLSCSVGYPGRTITVYPGGTRVNISYPVAWTPVKDALAELIREQFRRAARLVVTGEP
ncbi:MAG: hypothetical protein R3B48_19590 [Kofleriaceae bacterium]